MSALMSGNALLRKHPGERERTMALIKHSLRTKREGCKGCGSTDIYWAHDTDRPGRICPEIGPKGGKVCANPGVSGAFVLINIDGSRHSCKPWNTPETPESKPEPSPYVKYAPDSEPAPEPSKSVTEPSNGTAPSADKLAVAAQLLDALSPKVDANMVRQFVSDEHGQFREDLLKQVTDKISAASFPVSVKVESPSGETKTIEGCHKVLPTVVKVVGIARKHCLMVGPAGTGKSTIAEQVAESLGLRYFSISLSPQTPASSLLGYMQAAGEYVRSLYREAYEFGGVFHFDEFDNAHPSVLAVINASLANGHMAFPDGMVARHPEFRVCASANTYGRGPDRQYVGRQAIDAATLDRFAVVTVDIDEALEAKICHATGASETVVSEVLRYVRSIRKNAEDGKKALIFSPRASEGMCSLIAAGIPVSEAIEMRVRRGISDADWQSVTSRVTLPNL